MKQLNISDILNVNDIQTKKVEIPEWGGYVVIQSMSAEARDHYELSILNQSEDGKIERNLQNARAKLVSACVLGSDGKRMFKTDQHVEALGTKSAKIVDRLFTECQQLNAISDEDVKEISGN